VPQGLAEWVGGLGWNPYVILLLILCLYLLFGCVMDSLSMILLTIPIFFPVILSLDFGLLDFTSLQLEAVAEVLLGDLSGFAADQLAEARAALEAGLPLAQDTARALGINLTEARVARMEAELVAIWFGILVLIVVETGLITPPVGMNLFVISAMDRDTPVSATYRAVLYFVTSDLLRVALLVAFPAITLIWLI
jgi:TRAP-type C4-dicarboxylate transport system permease large subunit